MLGLENILNNENIIKPTKGTKLAKIKYNIFEGFYDKDIHSNLVYDTNEEGEKVLKEEFIEISDIFWNSLLEGQSQGKEIRYIVEQDRLGLYEKKTKPENLIKPEYNYYTHFWEEKATLQEQVDYLDEEMVKVDMNIDLKEREMNSRARRGLGTSALEQELFVLRAQLESLEDRHMNVSHAYALALEKIEVK
ncbi:MAG: hypothetical protein ACRCRT_02190 [Cetobacterium somerae]